MVVEHVHAQRSLAHGRQDLHLRGTAQVAHQQRHAARADVRFGFRDVQARVAPLRRLSFQQPVRGADDRVLGRLPVHLGQAHGGRGLRQGVQGQAGVHRGQLVGVAHQQHPRARRDRREQREHQAVAAHADLVHDQQVVRGGFQVVVPEARRAVPEQAVNGAGAAARHLAQAAGGLAGRGAQADLQAQALGEVRDGAGGGALAGAGAAGQDDQPVLPEQVQHARLLGGQALCRAFRDDPLVPGGGRGDQRADQAREFLLGAQGGRQVDATGIVQRVLRVQQGRRVVAQTAQFHGGLHGQPRLGGGHAGVVRHAPLRARARQERVPALLRRLLQGVHGGGRQAARVVQGAALRLPQLVGGQEADALDLGQHEQVRLQAFQGRLAEVLHGPLRLRDAQAQALQPGQQAAFQALLRPAGGHLVQGAARHARHLHQAVRVVFQDVEGRRAERLGDAARQDLAHAAHPRFQVRGDSRLGQVGRLGFEDEVQHAVLVAVLAVLFHQHVGAEGVPGFQGRHDADHGGVRVLALLVADAGGHDREARVRAEAHPVHTAGHAESLGRRGKRHRPTA